MKAPLGSSSSERSFTVHFVHIHRYDVRWEYSDVKWASDSRWDVFLYATDEQARAGRSWGLDGRVVTGLVCRN